MEELTVRGSTVKSTSRVTGTVQPTRRLGNSVKRANHLEIDRVTDIRSDGVGAEYELVVWASLYLYYSCVHSPDDAEDSRAEWDERDLHTGWREAKRLYGGTKGLTR